jgi:hypothetical protein
MIRRALLIAAVAALAAGLPGISEILGMQIAGSAWNALRSSSPWLSQAGELCGGLLGGVVLGGFLKAIAQSRWWPWPLAGLAAAAVYSVYAPATLLIAPAAAALAGWTDRRPQRWMTGLSIAAALAAMAHLLPFPRPAALALCLCAGLSSAWGYPT